MRREDDNEMHIRICKTSPSQTGQKREELGEETGNLTEIGNQAPPKCCESTQPRGRNLKYLTKRKHL
jgi:hypothetical protein